MKMMMIHELEQVEAEAECSCRLAQEESFVVRQVLDGMADTLIHILALLGCWKAVEYPGWMAMSAHGTRSTRPQPINPNA